MTVYKVFHGSRESIDHSGAASGGLGDWFGTDDQEYVARYGKVKMYKITLRNPYYMNVKEFRSYDRGLTASFEKSKKFREELEKNGYDGIIVTHHDGVKEYILFDKSNVRRILL